MVVVSFKNICLVIFLVVASFFAHIGFQQLYFKYCISNIFLVYLFKNSNFCIILEDAIMLIEVIFRKFLA